MLNKYVKRKILETNFELVGCRDLIYDFSFHLRSWVLNSHTQFAQTCSSVSDSLERRNTFQLFLLFFIDLFELRTLKLVRLLLLQILNTFFLNFFHLILLFN